MGEQEKEAACLPSHNKSSPASLHWPAHTCVCTQRPEKLDVFMLLNLYMSAVEKERERDTQREREEGRRG
jgi:hypothetical protein